MIEVYKKDKSSDGDKKNKNDGIDSISKHIDAYKKMIMSSEYDEMEYNTHR